MKPLNATLGINTLIVHLHETGSSIPNENLILSNIIIQIAGLHVYIIFLRKWKKFLPGLHCSGFICIQKTLQMLLRLQHDSLFCYNPFTDSGTFFPGIWTTLRLRRNSGVIYTIYELVKWHEQCAEYVVILMHNDNGNSRQNKYI